MPPALLISLIQNVLIPEVAVAIRAHHNATGQFPTDAQVIAALAVDADGVIARGQSFLASKGAA